MYNQTFHNKTTDMRAFLSFFLFAVILSACNVSSAPENNAENQTSNSETESETSLYQVKQANSEIAIDGKPEETIWASTEWRPLDQYWLGGEVSKDDFSGKYKLAWSEDYLYVLAEIQDDTLIDINPDGLVSYWDDDCLEIFVDEDASGGNHQYSHNAFAYHLSLDGKCVDINPDSVFTYYNDHVVQARSQAGTVSTWEVAVKLFDDSFKDGEDNTPAKLKAGKEIGFMLAYCDNDSSPVRESFVGSNYVEGEDKNRGWIDAGIFEKIRLGE